MCTYAVQTSARAVCSSIGPKNFQKERCSSFASGYHKAVTCSKLALNYGIVRRVDVGVEFVEIAPEAVRALVREISNGV
jgi:hypothetical protein